MTNFCPSKDFKEGEPNGKCWGVGHYECKDIYRRQGWTVEYDRPAWDETYDGIFTFEIKALK